MMDITQEIMLTPLQFLPLTSNNNIVQGNALRIDWNDLVPAKDCDYIIGNPPFVARAGRVAISANGSKGMTSVDQKEDKKLFFGTKSGNIDYVACWFMKAALYMNGTNCVAALVATNSIVQGEQTAPIWSRVLDTGADIVFAWESFKWSSEVRGSALVYVVIVAISHDKSLAKRIYGSAGVREVEHINNYLKPGENTFIYDRSTPICDVPKIGIGSQPIDNGYFLFTESEKENFLINEPAAAKYFHPWVGADELINGKKRWALWLGNATPDDLDHLPLCLERVEKVREYRLSSNRAQTRKAAETPTHFGTEIISSSESVVIPEVSSMRRNYIPIAFVDRSALCSNKVRMMPNASLYHFAILASQFHNAWMRTVAGYYGPSYQYSAGVVYNNFIWPSPTPEQRQAIEHAAQAVLDARDAHPGKSLADLYDPDKMPADLLAAHKALDKAVEEAYGVNFNGDEEKIVAHLFKLYAEATNES